MVIMYATGTHFLPRTFRILTQHNPRDCPQPIIAFFLWENDFQTNGFMENILHKMYILKEIIIIIEIYISPFQ